MNQKINQFEYFFVVTILSIVVFSLMGLLIYCIVDSIIWLFIGGDFLFSIEYVKKITKASVWAGLVVGIGAWFIEYKLRR
ncbi:hypothetical protein [Xenorhabdus sp. PB62.4]|uniref:hypothetical protein n=1 Tax=Xenorhabdus sp. PB62.4 TaxID=1851573 RepID=UPI00165760FC|nr:hypothetical protein [Xenorhabdus sp. PB62.4]MBC8954449.1 hypothetical protein [Xenorhabdus sp. PB62.4]